MRYIEKSSVVLEIRTALSGQKTNQNSTFAALGGKKTQELYGKFSTATLHPVTGRAFGDDNSVTKEFGDVTAREYLYY